MSVSPFVTGPQLTALWLRGADFAHNVTTEPQLSQLFDDHRRWLPTEIRLVSHATSRLTGAIFRLRDERELLDVTDSGTRKLVLYGLLLNHGETLENIKTEWREVSWVNEDGWQLRTGSRTLRVWKWMSAEIDDETNPDHALVMAVHAILAASAASEV